MTSEAQITDQQVAQTQGDQQQPAQQQQQQAPQESPRDAFIKMLPQELRTDGVFANFQSVEDLAKSYSSAAKMVGLDKNALLAVPKDDSKEAWDAVYNKLGRPESPDKYNLEPYKEYAADGSLKPWTELSHSLGLNQKQIDGIFGKFFGEAKAQQEQQQKQLESQFEAWKTELKTEYGLAFDEKITSAVNALEKVGGESLMNLIKENPQVFKHPAFAKYAVAIAEKTGESTVLLANGQTTSGALSPQDAKQQLSAMSMDSNIQKALMDKAHPQHQYYVEQRQKLFAYAYPDVKTA